MPLQGLPIIEWLTNELGMRFYYWTGLSWLILFPVYLVGAGLITLLWVWLARRIKGSWAIAVPLYAALVIAPWVIAWNFGHLCRKDAGTFNYKTVEVEGYYDPTAGLLQVYQPLPKPTADYYDKAGFKFYELSLANTQGGPSKVVHYEKVNGEWVATVLDRPTARYHYRANRYGVDVAHGIQRFEDSVVDTQTDETLGRYVIYFRDAPWFFIGLDRPTIPCRETQEATRKYGSLIYQAVLKPQNR